MVIMQHYLEGLFICLPSEAQVKESEACPLCGKPKQVQRYLCQTCFDSRSLKVDRVEHQMCFGEWLYLAKSRLN
jgi:hypothetical protein